MGNMGEYRSFLSTIVAAAALLLSPTVADAVFIPPEGVVIDDFKDPNSYADLTVESGGVLFASDEDTGLDPAHVIGGVRELTLDGTGGGLTAGSARARISNWDLWVEVSEDAVPGATLELHYGTLAPSGSELNSDWSCLEMFRMAIDIATYDDTPIGGFVELYWDDGGPGEGSMAVPFELPYVSSGLYLDILLTDFTGADLTDIDGVRVEFGTMLTKGQHLSLAAMAVTPEPATLLVLAAGGLGLFRRRRRA